MRRYLVEVEQNGCPQRSYRDAESPEDAALQAFRGCRSDFRVEAGRAGTSHSFGSYVSFVGRAGRIIAVARVYTREGC
jgi:hypothetical protein